MVRRLFSILDDDSTEKPGWLLTVIVCVLAAIPRLTSLRAFLALDETLYWKWAHTFFFALLQGDWLSTIVGPGNPGITIFWSHVLNMGLKYAWAWLNGVQATALATWPDFQPQPTFDLLIERRLPIVLFNTLAVVVAYRLIRRLLGGRIALFAAVLLALDPFYLSDSRTSRGEGLWASLAILAVLFYLAYWTTERSRYLVFSGVMTGLGLLTKISAVSLVIWAIVVTPVLALARSGSLGRSQVKRVFAAWIVWGLVTVITFWAVWPAMWASPEKALGFLWSYVADVGVTGRDNYFFGQLYQSEPLPLYYIVVFVLRVTPLAWLGLLAGLGYLAHSYLQRHRPNLVEPESRESLLTLLILVFALVYGTVMTVGTLKRDFYLIPVFPALDIVAAVGLVWIFWQVKELWFVRLSSYWIFQAAEQRWRSRWANKLSPQAIGAGGWVAILILQAVTILPAYPYYYTYWNPAVLGSRWATHAVMVHYEVELTVGAYYLNTKPHAEDLWVATHTTRSFEELFKGHTARWVPEEPWIRADYLLVRQYHLQRRKIEPHLLEYLSHFKLDHVVTLGGVDYLWIYEGPRAQYFAGPSTLAGKATLLGYNLGDRNVTAGGTLPVKLYWQNKGMTPDDDLFSQLVDAGGYVWAETVSTPLPGFETAALTNEQIVESQAALTTPVGTPPGTYFLRIGVYSRARQEILGHFTLPADGDKVTVARPISPPSATGLSMAHRLEARVSPEVSLLGFDLADDTLASSDNNWLTLYWRANADVGKDYVIGLQLLAPDGKEATYWLGRPVMSSYPTNQWTAGEIVSDAWRLDLPTEVSPGDYTLRLTLFRADTQAEAGRVTLGHVSVVERRRRFDIPVMKKVVNTGLGDRVTLLGYDLFAEPITGGGRLQVALYWQAQEAMESSYTVFVHLLGPDGAVVAQHDGVPAGGALPTEGWALGEVVADRHAMEFADLPAGEYRLVVGMYNPTTGERLSIAGGDTAVVLQAVTIN